MSKKLLGKLFVILLVAGLLFAVAPTMQAKADATVSNETELRAALAGSEPVIELGADIALANELVITRAVTIDLNGKTLSKPATASVDRVFHVQTGGNLTVNDTGGGIVSSPAADGMAFEMQADAAATMTINGGAFTAGFRNIVNQTNTLIVNGGTIHGEDLGIAVRGNRTTTEVKTTTLTVNDGTISSGDYPAVHVAGYGATFNLKGGLLTGDGGRTGAPVLMGNGSSPDWGTEINISGGEIYAPGGTGISQPQQGVLNISGGQITADTGIEIKSGTLNMTGGSIVANGPKVDPPVHGPDGTTLSGDGVFVVTRTGYNWPINVNLTGGSISSANAWAVREFLHDTVTESKSVTIINGTTLSGGALLLKPVVNVTKSLAYTTIQAAIDATSTMAGDVIEVADGIYNYDSEGQPADAGLIKITKPVTLRAADDGNTVRPVINASGAGGVTNDGVFKIHATQFQDGLVVIEGFDITGIPQTGIAITAPMYQVPGHENTIIIRDNLIHGMIGAIDFWGTTSFVTDPIPANAVVSHVEITGNKIYDMGVAEVEQGLGVMIEDPKSDVAPAIYAAKITNNEFYNFVAKDGTNPSAAIVLPRADTANGEDLDVLIQDNKFGAGVNVNVGIQAGAAITGPVIIENDFSNSGVGVYSVISAQVSGTPNWWGSAAGPSAGQIVGNVTYSPWCANAECTEFLPAQVTIAQPTSVVCGNTTTSTIDIMVAGIPTSAPLQAYSFYLEFDENKVSIGDLLSFENGEFLGDGAFQLHPVDGDLGKVQIAYTAYGESDSVGGGKLATIPLNLLGVAGDVSLVLSGVELSTFEQQYLIPAEASTTPVILTLDPAVINTTQSDAGYCSLAQAVDAAVAGDNLKLVADIAIPETVTVDLALTLDLNGKTATVAAGKTALSVDTEAGAIGALIITDSTTGGLGKITGGARAVQVLNGASLVLNKGTLDGTTSDGVFVKTGSSVTVNGGTVTGLYFAIAGNGSAGQGGTTINITGGSLSSDYTAIYVPQSGSVDISGGTIIGHTGIEVRSGSLTISGGSITATGQYLPVPGTYSNGSLESGDAIFVNTNPDYAGDMVISISGGTFTSETGYALREYVYDSAGVTEVETLTVTGGTFIGGVDDDEAGAAVTFSTQLTASQAPELALQGGLYNTDPASPDVFVFVPYGTVYNTTASMYEIVGISLNVTDFYYNNDGILRGVSTDFTVTNFVFAEATSVTVELFSGAGTTESPWALQQTNTLKAPASWDQSTLSSSFDIFGTYVSGSWNNTRATEYGQHVPPTRVLVTVVLPGGTLTAEMGGPSFEYSLIDPVLVAEDFAYMAQSGVRGVTAGFHPVNFTLDQALTLKVELFAGTQLLQTNISPVPSVHGVALLQPFSGPFDIFGTFDYTTDYATGTTVYWENTRQAEYGQTIVPTRVLATVTLPGGVTRTVENTNLTGTRTDILPVVNGFVYMQGRFAGTGPRFGVPLMLKDAANVEYHATSSDLTTINYGFAGLELQEYTITTNQPRYLNIYFDDVDDTDGVFSIKFTITGDRTLPELRLRAGNAVWTDNVINTVDAGQVGTDWNGTFDVAYTGPCGDVNFDGKVNIQDLALVGGNYELTSADAYGTWLQ